MSIFKGRIISAISKENEDNEGSIVSLDDLVSKYLCNPEKLKGLTSRSYVNQKLNNMICGFDFNLAYMTMIMYFDSTVLEIPIDDIRVDRMHNNPNNHKEGIRWFNMIKCIIKSRNVSMPGETHSMIELIISTDLPNNLDFIWSNIETDRHKIKVHFNVAISTEEVVEWWKLTYDRIPTENDDNCTEWIYNSEDQSCGIGMRNLWIYPRLAYRMSDYTDISDTWNIEFTGNNKRKISEFEKYNQGGEIL